MVDLQAAGQPLQGMLVSATAAAVVVVVVVVVVGGHGEPM